MLYKVIDLDTETSYLYKGRGFCSIIGISEANFLNRWRLKKSIGIVFNNKWYVKEVVICE